ncbi:ribonuclease P protein component [Candidatus Woesebacteria bacterium]|nr:ribonuclease P protein component [Candidatus Woesebacteria bacterium]MCD8507011.1 ribonuclease P protein component [Candidatus Woesebacteria bacterium]MCD8527302.1 ribonuclease P protein component [Candidatus Woesebacteria bacterium]MCD8546667.1 ribonuclease P protein component [Candidatus Woesebacteria bacterium]
MLPAKLRFPFRKYPDFFQQSRWGVVPGAKNDPLLRSLSFRVQQKDDSGLRWAIVTSKKVGNAVVRAQNKRFVRQAIIELSREDASVFALPYNVVVYLRSSLSSTEEAKQIITQFLRTIIA